MEDGSGKTLRRPRVLVVDDSSFARRVIGRVIEQSGEFEVAGFAEDGEQAIARVHSLSPDVVTLDCHMPGLSGAETLARLRGESAVPVVLVTSAPFPPEMNASAGWWDVTGIVTKTFAERSLDLSVFSMELLTRLRMAVGKTPMEP
ncbi:MAG: response regulator [bacterium]|nr:response regulator [bacterium]